MKLRVQGKLACYTRPETKVERFSYDVPTPSVVKGIFEAVYWKKEFQWEPKSVSVLAPIKRMTYMTNEVKSIGRTDITKSRTQRRNTVLCDVDYIMEADIVCGSRGEYRKHAEIFERRMRRGECFHPPCLGLKQFRAYVSPAEDLAAISDTRSLGIMFYGWDYSNGDPMFFHAEMVRGTVNIPPKTEVIR